MAGLELAAVADREASKWTGMPGVQTFAQAEEFIAEGTIDAVLICTPHFAHTPLGIVAREKGLHVLLEKPISVFLRFEKIGEFATQGRS